MHKPWKAILVTTALTLALPVTHADTIRLSEPVASDANSETFGEPLDQSLPQLSLEELVTNAENNLGKEVVVETRIAKVCQKKGCFFMATDGALAVRVSFKDYGFFIPTDSSGKHVTLSGELIERELSAEQAAHYSADMADASSKLEAGNVYEIVADSVRIPR